MLFYVQNVSILTSYTSTGLFAQTDLSSESCGAPRHVAARSVAAAAQGVVFVSSAAAAAADVTRLLRSAAAAAAAVVVQLRCITDFQRLYREYRLL